jgi:hypothetical protein
VAKKPTLEQVKLAIIFVLGAAAWVYMLKCTYEATPFLQWLDNKYPIIAIPLFGVVTLAPLLIGERIERAARKD